jgi:SAM-dependent methyltransferase
MFEPHAGLPGGFSPNDGTLDFYMRVGTLSGPDRVMLDLGAGRGGWFEDDEIPLRRQTRLMRGRFSKVFAVDVDEAVLDNRSVDQCLVMRDQRIPLPDETVDVVVADFVLEHVSDPVQFSAEVHRVLRPGGWFCARTPHKYHYVTAASRFLKNASHAGVLKRVQPDRKDVDVFPTSYKMNTLREIRRAFPSYDDHSCVFRCDPAYYFGSRLVWTIQTVLHQIAPAAISGNIFAFLKKPSPDNG